MRTKAAYNEHTNTTLGCVITNARLSTMQAKRLAVMAHDGFARALYPVHTPADGDLIFAMSTGHIDIDSSVMVHLGTAAARATSRAIAIGVFNALQQETE